MAKIEWFNDNQPIQNENKDSLILLKGNFDKLIWKWKCTEEWFKLFSRLPKGDINKVLNLLETKKFKVIWYFKLNWFPNNKTKNIFFAFFWLSSRKTIIDVNKNKITKSKRIYLEEYEKIKDVKSDNKVFEDLKAKLAWLDEWSVKLEEVTVLLEKLDDKEFRNLLEFLKKYDKENWTKLYSSFKNTLISIDSSFEWKINEFENKRDLTGNTLDLSGIISKSVQDSSLVWDDLYKGGIDATLDLTKRPPERFLVMGEYKMESPLWVRDFYSATVTYEKWKQKLDKDIWEVMKEWKETHSKLENKKRRKEELENKKTEVELSEVEKNELIEINNKIIELKNKIELLSDKYYAIKSEYKELEKEYRVNLAREVKNYRKTIKEQDEKQLETLRFLHSIGFDLIPQNITNLIITQIKQTNYVQGLTLNPATIDLENWTFWENTSDFWKETLWNKWKENLIKFMEKMIYWEIWSEKSIFNNKSWKVDFNLNRTDIIGAFENNSRSKGDNIKTGATWNINAIRNNLKKDNLKDK